MDFPINITTHFLCYNEEKLLPYFLRHYGRYARRMVFYDNGSTDRSREIIQAHPNAEIIPFGKGNMSQEELHTEIKNNCWMNSPEKPDYVIVGDLDEFIYHTDLGRFFQEMYARRYTVFRPLGFNMVSESFPTNAGQIFDEVKLGCRDRSMDKCIVFSPSDITAINFSDNGSRCDPQGNVKMWMGEELRLLHMRGLGQDYVNYKEVQWAGRRRTVTDLDAASKRYNDWKFNSHVVTGRPSPQASRLRCPSCHRIFSIEQEDRGNVTPCVWCSKRFRVPPAKAQSCCGR
jgi:hypothetical protein